MIKNIQYHHKYIRIYICIHVYKACDIYVTIYMYTTQVTY